MPTPQLRAPGTAPKNAEEICLFGQTNYRNQMRRFGIKVDDRRRHMYVIGKTGMGKTTIMENMVLSDIYAGHGVGLVDPHGDFAEKIINHIPSWRLNDVVYLNPADTDNPIGFNILEVKNEEQAHLIAGGLMGTFKKIWPDVWSSRMEYILNNTLLALLDYPGSTLLGVNRLLSDKEYRKRVVRNLKDPVIKAFWRDEFANYDDRYAKEAVAPIQNKIGQFLSASVIRNMVAQVKSTINVRELMDSQKIFIMNLSKGRIGEDNSRLLGGMLITKLQLAAMERVDTPEPDRKDFFLYVDEFQNFATPSFANILSEARKYRLSLIMAHQYVAQLDEVVADAVFGNVGTIVTFRVGGADAEMLVKEFTPTFTEEDIVNLTKFQIILKLMIDGVASQPFSAATLPPLASPTDSAEKVIRVSRERYGKKRELVEEKIARWSSSSTDEEDAGAESETVLLPENKELKKLPSAQPVAQLPKPQPQSQSPSRPQPRREDRRPDDRRQNQEKKEVPRERKPEEIKEAVISLTSLTPRTDTRPQPKQQSHSTANNAPVENRPPRPQSIQEVQQRQSESQTQNQTQGEPGTKKRRRRRKRGNRDAEGNPIGGSPSMGNGGNNQSTPRNNSPSNTELRREPPAVQSVATPPLSKAPEPPAAPQPPKQSEESKPKKINENEEISFDDLV
ncbi:MAG: type IV secretion system DNA-binding domain-containing protein [Candidatus Magasanikbacteria bacterium]|nr:type IV secretion system DNA-binding domain-containing protein [Candidatus Magasanikbacteria bacterium]